MQQLQLTQTELQGWRDHPKFPLLYHTDAGKVRVWACWVVENVLYRTDGLSNGKFKEPSQYTFGGNTVKTPEEQATAEAEKRWISQLDKGYRPSSSDDRGVKIYESVLAQKSQNGGMNRGVRMFSESEITTGTTAGEKDLDQRHCPMLAKKYKDYDKNEELVLTNQAVALKFPCLVQPKLDGLRALPRISGSHVVLESRNGKDYMFLNHIRRELHPLLKGGIVLDGELYVHRLYKSGTGYDTVGKGTELKSVERFQFLSEACKITRKSPHPYEELVQFWVFDLWDPSKTNLERWRFLEALFKDYKGTAIKLVPTFQVHSHEEIEKRMDEFVGKGHRNGYQYEGLMVRQSAAKYNHKNGYHCDDLLKYKRFEDEEWIVTGAEECAGNHAGAVKWVCELNGRKLVAKQMGDLEESRRLFTDFQKHPKKFLGHKINIRFNERSKDGIPRFPRATAFREDL